MKIHLTLALLVLAVPAFAGDMVVTKKKHTDAATIMNQEQPAQDTQEVTWVGKDKMRVEEGDRVTIVRNDLKKMYLLDTKAKTVSTVDLPFDLSKSLPEGAGARMMEFMSQVKFTVTPTTETKKVGEWNATHYTMTMTMPGGAGSSTREMWVTKDVKIDLATLHSMYAAVLSATPIGTSLAAEMQKIDGYPVLIEETKNIMNSTIESTEEVVSIEDKEPAAGLYDVPAGFTEKPFDPMAGMMGGSAAGRARKQ